MGQLSFKVEPSASRRVSSVLLVSSDRELRSEIGGYLRQQGFFITEAPEPDALDAGALAPAIDLIVLDSSTPGGDGLGVCRRLSVSGGPPTILLAPTIDPIDRIVGLEVGADDCVGKPVNTRELLARIRALLRRAGMDSPSRGAGEDFVFAGFRLSVRGQSLHPPEGPTQTLAPAEFNLLRHFLEHPNEVLSRQRLQALSGEPAATSDRHIDRRVQRLREKLVKAGGDPDLIRTVSRRGYLLDAYVQPAPAAGTAPSSDREPSAA